MVNIKRVRRPNPRYVDSIPIEDGLKGSPQLVREAIIAELMQLEEMGAFEPIHREAVSQRIIPSKMLVKKKVNSQGKITKVKLVSVLVDTVKKEPKKHFHLLQPYQNLLSSPYVPPLRTNDVKLPLRM